MSSMARRRRAIATCQAIAGHVLNGNPDVLGNTAPLRGRDTSPHFSTPLGMLPSDSDVRAVSWRNGSLHSTGRLPGCTPARDRTALVERRRDSIFLPGGLRQSRAYSVVLAGWPACRPRPIGQIGARKGSRRSIDHRARAISHTHNDRSRLRDVAPQRDPSRTIDRLAIHQAATPLCARDCAGPQLLLAGARRHFGSWRHQSARIRCQREYWSAFTGSGST